MYRVMADSTYPLTPSLRGKGRLASEAPCSVSNIEAMHEVTPFL